jgi:hypothetical protein
VALHLDANNRFDSLQNSCGETAPGCTADQINGLKTRDHATTALSILGGAAALLTGLAFFVNW